jgi:hypothetical protein
MMEITGNNFEKITVKAWDQKKTRKFGVGDLGIRMFLGLFRSILRQVKKEKPDLILYPVPPWYIMLMAPLIRRITKIPYAIDYIDPWVFKLKNRDLKARLSQWIAKRTEGMVLRRSGATFAVSEGILDELRLRYPELKSRPMIAVPYGVEASDYQTINAEMNTNGKVLMRYTGAVSENMLPVIDVLLKAMKKLNDSIPLEIQFTGTTYAGAGLAKPVLVQTIKANKVGNFVVENPSRVGYQTALELGMGADFQLLIGDITPYYAASKMMGLVASGKPFFALLNKDSFPATFLRQIQYKDMVLFSPDQLGNPALTEIVYQGLLKAIKNKDQYKAVSTDHPVFSKYTAMAMTKTFTDTFQKIIR